MASPSSSDSTSQYDIEFFFDPVCPFAWQTSRWVRMVVEQKGLSVDWRFISLALINGPEFYLDKRPGYRKGHERGRELLRVAAAARDAHGREAIGPLYAAYGEQLWMQDDGYSGAMRILGDRPTVEEALKRADLPTELADNIENGDWDAALREETELAFSRTGREVGTPIITYEPPDGISLFGPVISVVPEPEDAVRLWDAVTTLGTFPGFAELKRSMRDPLDVPAIINRAT
jgi:hypothetical protein